MSDLNNDLENLVSDMGMSVSDSPETTEQPVEQPVETQEENVQESVQEEVQQSPELSQDFSQQEEAVQEQPQSSLQQEIEYSEEDVETAMLQYLSERLGRQVSSFEEIQGVQNTSVEIDERVAAINDFVRQTGRNPQDWFTYQSLNTSEMDDMTAVRIQLRSQYGDLSESDLNLLVENKYKLDADMYDDSEVRLSQIQLKMDADNARREIDAYRNQFAAPVQQAQQSEAQYESIINEQWLNDMSSEVDALDGIEFEVAKGKSFTFGLENNYKSQLKSKNERIEDFFSSYVSNDGQWDFEKWNMHQAVLDNIETIVKTAYQQGLGEGQRGLVNKAANVQYQPNKVADTGQSNVPNVEEQIRQALGLNDNGLTFKL